MKCEFCEVNMNPALSRPDVNSFKKYLSFFLQDNPDSVCAKAGHASYSQAVNYKVDENNNTIVEATYYMAFHTILKTSSEYYGAIREARMIADNITEMINTNIQKLGGNTMVNVFPYSVFYVFFEQYLTMWPDTLKSIGISLGAVFLVTFVLIGLDLVLSLIVVITITMIIVNLGGLMYFLDITLNAVSLVNLVMVGPNQMCFHINV
ncbi:hypothetical protein J6590_045798 [Homalodisca vitripennis]|nr:hypothetical protein J6590_045798 [Homalodisca vitripennis]